MSQQLKVCSAPAVNWTLIPAPISAAYNRL